LIVLVNYLFLKEVTLTLARQLVFHKLNFKNPHRNISIFDTDQANNAMLELDVYIKTNYKLF